MNFLIKYYQEIAKGNILVGEELLKQFDNIIADLENPKYYFDYIPLNVDPS